MTIKDFKDEKAVLTFEGEKYIIEELSEDIKEIITSIQIADAQLKMHEDTLKLISIGKNNLINNLRKKLEDI
tara:strand:- start:104 stop:319 length:216 start_codon:yes stop_codon:yes gene_type:complete